MSTINDRQELGNALEAQRGNLDRLRKAWRGDSPASYLSQQSRKALDSRLARLGVNIPRLVVNAKVDRMSIAGWKKRNDQSVSEPRMWDLWTAGGMVQQSELVHTDYYLYGQTAVVVWPDATGRPRPFAASPMTCVVDTDPGTGMVERAARAWSHAGQSHMLVYTAAEITYYTSPSPSFTPGAGSWAVQSRDLNPFDPVLPIVPFVRRQSADDLQGTSAVEDILDLADALGKVLSDALVTSEHYARPRRWATGLEIEVDKNGRPVDPFGDSRFLQSEDPATKFGQFDAVRLDGYTDLTATITQQIGSLTGLPAHYLGLHGDQPANADGVRAAEAQLASAAYSDHRALEDDWSRVAQLMAAIVDMGADPAGAYYRPVWTSPEIRTPSQAADAALKHRDIGIPLDAVLVNDLGYSPAEAERIAKLADRERIVKAAESLNRIRP